MNKIMTYKSRIIQAQFSDGKIYEDWITLLSFLSIIVSLLLLLLIPQSPFAQEIGIGDIDVRINGDELIVSTSITLPGGFINEIKNGVQKELVFYIDLFRVWKNWPDEYVFGNSIVKKIEGDVIKGEFIMSSFDRNKKIVVEKNLRALSPCSEKWQL